jgi:hypothetical protein
MIEMFCRSIAPKDRVIPHVPTVMCVLVIVPLMSLTKKCTTPSEWG